MERYQYMAMIEETEDEVCVLGRPLMGHNCDAMGCASIGAHVLHRFRKNKLIDEQAKEIERLHDMP